MGCLHAGLSCRHSVVHFPRDTRGMSRAPREANDGDLVEWVQAHEGAQTVDCRRARTAR